MSDGLQNPLLNMQDEIRIRPPTPPPPPSSSSSSSVYTDRRMLLVPSWQSANYAGQEHRTAGRNKISKGEEKDEPKGKDEPKEGKGEDEPKGKDNSKGKGKGKDEPKGKDVVIMSQDAQDLQAARLEIERLQYQNMMLLRMNESLLEELTEFRQTVG